MIDCPSNARSAISVAAVDMHGRTAPFSSRGPGGCLRPSKPTLACYGVSIRMINHRGQPHVASGTSFSSPFVLGMAMCVSEMLGRRGHKPTPHEVNAVLNTSCVPALSSNPNEVGAGIPNLKKAASKIGFQMASAPLRPIRQRVAVAACIALLAWAGLTQLKSLNSLASLPPGNYVILARVEKITPTKNGATIHVSDVSDSAVLRWADAGLPAEGRINVLRVTVDDKKGLAACSVLRD